MLSVCWLSGVGVGCSGDCGGSGRYCSCCNCSDGCYDSGNAVDDSDGAYGCSVLVVVMVLRVVSVVIVEEKVVMVLRRRWEEDKMISYVIFFPLTSVFLYLSIYLLPPFYLSSYFLLPSIFITILSPISPS